MNYLCTLGHELAHVNAVVYDAEGKLCLVVPCTRTGPFTWTPRQRINLQPGERLYFSWSAPAGQAPPDAGPAEGQEGP